MCNTHTHLPPPLPATTIREIGHTPRDTLIAARHSMVDHIMGPQNITEIFNSKARYRPHESRVLMEAYDPFYVMAGASRVIGTAWLGGIAVGGVQGFYEGLANRSTRSWKTAYQSLCSFSRTKAPLRANQLASIAFVFSFWEMCCRHFVITNATHLKYGDKGMIMGQFGSPKPDEKQVWQTDGRMCAVPAGALTAISMRLFRGGAGAKPGVLLSNAALAAVGGYLYSYAHTWVARLTHTTHIHTHYITQAHVEPVRLLRH